MREIVKNAFLPAIISYIALFYIVHLEACKTGIGACRAVEASRWLCRLLGIAMTLAGIVVLANVVYFVLGLDQARAPALSLWVIRALIAGGLPGAAAQRRAEPDLTVDSPSADLAAAAVGNRCSPACTTCCRSCCWSGA